MRSKAVVESSLKQRVFLSFQIDETKANKESIYWLAGCRSTPIVVSFFFFLKLLISMPAGQHQLGDCLSMVLINPSQKAMRHNLLLLMGDISER
jgi:hypothetical protein